MKKEVTVQAAPSFHFNMLLFAYRETLLLKRSGQSIREINGHSISV